MSYEEVAALLAELGMAAGERVYIVRGEELDTVALHIVPVAWFIAMKMAGRLYLGTYQGPDNRIVGTNNFTFEELKAEFLKEEVNNALADQVARMLDQEAIREFLKKLDPARGRGGFGGRNLGPL